MTNPLIQGKLIGENYDSGKYHEKQGEKGSQEYVMSRSELMIFDQCPKKWLLGVPPKESEAMRFGELVDCLITDAKRFEARFAVRPETYVSKDGETKPWTGQSKTCKQWIKDQGDRIILKNEEIIAAKQAEARLMGDALIRDLIQRSRKQVFITTIYKDEDTLLTVPIKVLIDLAPKDGDALADLKTVRSAAPKEWQRTVYQWDYHVQSSLYLDAFNSCGLKNQKTQFLHVLVENQPPFEPGRRILSEEFIALGRARYVAALQRYCRCLKEKRWPSYDDEGRDLVNGWRLVSPLAYMVEL